MMKVFHAKGANLVIEEVSDLFALLKSVHKSIDDMLQDVSDEQWIQRPLPNMNCIAPIMAHITLVERKFFSTLSDNAESIDTQAPFKSDEWNIAEIKSEWNAILPYAESVLQNITTEQLSEPGLKLGIGEVNKRQLIAYTIAHTTHHRGQIPIVKKLLPQS